MSQREKSNMDTSSQATGFPTVGTSEATTRFGRLFGVLRHLDPDYTRDVLFSSMMLRLGVIVEVIQPWSFIMSPHIPWTQSYWLVRVPYFFSLASLWDPSMNGISRMGGFVVFWLAIALLAGASGVLFYFYKSGAENDRAWSVLRVLIHALTVPLTVPVFHSILSQTVCHNDNLWLYPEEKCWDAQHILAFAAGLVGYIVLAGGTFLIMTTVYDNCCFSLHPAARAHPLLDRWYVLFKVVSPVMYHILLSRGMHQSYCFIMTVIGFLLTASYVVTVPYFSEARQRARVISLATLTWAALVGYVLVKDEKEEHLMLDDNAGIVLTLCLPAVWTGAWMLAMIRVSRRCLRDFKRVLDGTHQRTQYGPFPKYLPESDIVFTKYKDLEARFLEYETYEGEEQSEYAITSQSILSPYTEAVYTQTDVELSTRFLVMWHKHFLTRPTAAMLAMASRIYTKGACKFPESVLVKIHFADFLVRYLDGSSVCATYLSQVEHFEPLKETIYFRYTVFRMSTKLKAELGIKDRSYLVALSSARRHHRDALEQMLQFWTALCDKVNLNLMSLAVLANQITEHREKARVGFCSVLSQHSQDAKVLMHFASFLLQVMLDEESFQRCKDELEVVQDSRRSKRSGRSDGGTSTIMQSQVTGRAGASTSKNVQAILAALENSNSGRSGSRTVQVLQITIRVVFTPLVLLLLGNLLLTFLYSTQHTEIAEQMHSAGQARQLSQYGALVLQQYEQAIDVDRANAGTVTTTSGEEVQLLREKLSVIADAFSAHHNRLTFGSLMVQYPSLQSYFKKPALQMSSYATSSVAELKTLGLWGFGNALSTAFSVLVSLPSTGNEIAESPYTQTVLQNMNGPIADAFNKTGTYLEDRQDTLLDGTELALVVLFISAFMMVFVVDLTFVWNFNKIAASKMTTLELFTLIPPGTIQVTAADARDRITQFDSEGENDLRSTGRFNSSMGDDDLDPGDDEDDEGDGDMPGAAAGTASMTESQKRQMAMTKEEALRSLEGDRRQSIVAKMLAMGMEESRLIEEEMERSHMHGSGPHQFMQTTRAATVVEEGENTVGKGGQARSVVMPADTVSQSDVSEAAKANEQAQKQKKQSSDDDEESEQKSKSETGQRFTLTVSLLVALSLCLLIAGLIMSFATLYGVKDLEDRLSETTDSIQDVFELSRIVETKVSLSRSFSQFADLAHYSRYWDLIHSAAENEPKRRLFRFGLEEDEIMNLRAAMEASDKLHQWDMTMMKLVRDYYGLPPSSTREVEQHTWSAMDAAAPMELRRYFAELNRPPPPIPTNPDEPVRNVYEYSDRVSDSALPNKESREVVDGVSDQRVRVNFMISNALRCKAALLMTASTADTAATGLSTAEQYKARTVELRDEWITWHQRSVTQFSGQIQDSFSQAYSELLNSTGLFVTTSNGNICDFDTRSLAQADTYTGELEIFLQELRNAENKGAERLFKNAPDSESQIRIYTGELNKTRDVQNSFAAAALVDRHAQYMIYVENTQSSQRDTAVRAALTLSLSNWQKLENITLGTWKAGPEEKMTDIRAAARGLLVAQNPTPELYLGTQTALETATEGLMQLEWKVLLSVPGINKRDVLGSLKQHISRGVVFNDLYSAELRFLRASLSELRHKLEKRTSEDAHSVADSTRKKGDTVLALFALTITLLAGLILSPAKMFMLLPLTLVCAVAAGFAGTLSGGVDDHVLGSDRLRRVMVLENATRSAVDSTRELAQEYVQFSDPLVFDAYWRSRDELSLVENELVGVATFQDDALKAAMRHFPQETVLEEVKTQVRDYTDLLRQSRESTTLKGRLERTALALATTAGNRENSMSFPRVLQLHTWNLSAEATLLEDTLRYVGPRDTAPEGWTSLSTDSSGHSTDMESDDQLKYTIPENDLYCQLCTPVVRYNKARAVTSSEKYHDLVRLARAPLLKIADDATKRWRKFADTSRHDLDMNASVMTVLAAAAVALCVATILVLVAQLLHRRSESANEETLQQMNRKLFARMSRNIRIALLVVVALLVVLFVVVEVGLSETNTAVKNLNLATARQWLVARSVVVANAIPSSSAEAVIQARQLELRKLTAEMQRVNDLLFFGTRSGVYSFVGQDSTQDALQFGLETTMADADIAAIYRPCTATSTTGATATQANGESARTIREPVNTRYLSLLALLNAVAHHPDENTADRTSINNFVASANTLADELLQGLHEASGRYLSTSKSLVEKNVLFCSVIVALTVLVILAEYRFVFLPMIQQLATEEDGTKLMLNMIPAEVRESVPEIAEYFSTGRVSDEEKIKKQLQQSEKLLQNILPPAIARRLKAGESPIADDHKAITVAFCACVGFEEISREMPAHSVVSFLNDLFTKFDEITERFELEKIKTIGDIYFMCGGLTEKTASDHGLRVMDAVLHFFDALEEHKIRNNTRSLTMKAGINTGPAVAGVIGSKKVAYDLWGDAVNVSSRLCGTAQPGKVQIHPSTHPMVKNHFAFKERWVEAKGKGRLLTYVLESRTQQTPFSTLGMSSGY
eukprot:Hpha_TRINITY_DN14164_c0_g2::TRINITY_DN14164_c0_g2_i1::g.10508::m.10508